MIFGPSVCLKATRQHSVCLSLWLYSFHTGARLASFEEFKPKFISCSFLPFFYKLLDLYKDDENEKDKNEKALSRRFST